MREINVWFMGKFTPGLGYCARVTAGSGLLITGEPVRESPVFDSYSDAVKWGAFACAVETATDPTFSVHSVTA